MTFANLPTTRFARPGTESDSWRKRGIRSIFDAIATGRDTYPHFEIMREGCSFLRIEAAVQIHEMILNGSRIVLNDQYLLSLPACIDRNRIAFEAATFSSRESASHIHRKSNRSSPRKRFLIASRGVVCPPVHHPDRMMRHLDNAIGSILG